MKRQRQLSKQIQNKIGNFMILFYLRKGCMQELQKYSQMK